MWSGATTLAATLLVWAAPLQAQAVDPDLYGTNGTVNAQVVVGNTLYVGGSFSAVGKATGGFAAVDDGAGLPAAAFPRVAGTVNAIVSDGAGGWYIGGLFNSVGGQPRANLARILADLSVSAWNPTTDGSVQSLALSGGTLYVGGLFANAGGSGRPGLAAFDATSGSLLSWNPGSGGQYTALAVVGSTVYVGGAFTSLGGQPRNGIGAVDALTGLATSWNPVANANVFALVPVGNTIYVGGAFTSIGGQPRNKIAALDAVTATATAWNPNAGPAGGFSVRALAVDGSTIYAGGSFLSIGGQPRNRIAAIDASTGLVTPWNPDANNEVRSLLVQPGVVYVGGSFSFVGGQQRNRAGALDAGSGVATAWNPDAGGTFVFALGKSGATVTLGGSINGLAFQPRSSLAAFDLTSGHPTGWNPGGVNGAVNALASDGTTLYVGGAFTIVGAVTRNRLAEVDLASGVPTGWNPNMGGTVSALAMSAGSVYAGGAFTSAGGQTRNRVAQIDRATGSPTAWDPNANGAVAALALDGATVYAGGAFTSIGGQSRSGLAALDATSGLATSWNPSATGGTVASLAVKGVVVYVGGAFTSLGGQLRAQVGAVDAATGLATSWNANAGAANITTIAVSNSAVYVGGGITSMGVESRRGIAALDPATGAVLSWCPVGTYGTGNVNSLVLSGSSVFAGGSFSSMEAVPVGFMARIAAVPLPPAPLNVVMDPPEGGSVSRDPNLLLYEDGTPVTLTATSSPGYHFVNWSGDLSGSASPRQVLISGPVTITAHFEFDYAPVLAQQAFGGSDVTSERASWVIPSSPTPGTVDNMAGTHLMISEIVTSPTAHEYIEIYNPSLYPVDLSNHYLTDAWSSSPTVNSYHLLPTGTLQLSTSSDFCVRFPAGAIIGPHGTIVVAVYGPGVDSTFGAGAADFEIASASPIIPDMINVGGAAGPTAGVTTLTDAAEFAMLFYWDGTADLVCDIDYVPWGPSSGTSRIDKTGLSVDGPDLGVATSAYRPDTPPSDQSSAPVAPFFRRNFDEGYETPFGGNGCIACATQPPLILNTIVEPSRSGSVAKSPNRPLYESGAAVDLTPVPALGYHFVGWSEDVAGSNSPQTVIVDGCRTVVAHFELNRYPIVASAGPGGTITPDGAVLVTHAADQTFYIAADPGYDIENVVVDHPVDGTSVGAAAAYTFPDVTRPHTIAATFVKTHCQAFVDPFAGGLQPGWTIARENPSKWSVVNDQLHIELEAGDLFSHVDDAHNLFLRPLPQGDCIIQTRAHMNLVGFRSQAHLVLYRDDRNYVRFGPGVFHEPVVNSVHEVGGAVVDGLDHEVHEGIGATPFPFGSIYLRIVKSGDTALLQGGFLSNEWRTFATIPSLGFVPTHAGLVAFDANWTASGSSVDFDYLAILQEGASTIAGTVTGTCNGLTDGLYGVTVDLFSTDTNGVDLLVASTATDTSGAYAFPSVTPGTYTATIVTPLGYQTATPTRVVGRCGDGPEAGAFELVCVPITAQPRSLGYWKHQVNVFLSGKGTAQETLDALVGYINLIVQHFNENIVNPVIVYVPGSTGTTDKLLQLQQLLTINRGGTNLDRAKQQLLSLLLNVVSAKIHQTQVISDNGATVSQAITYCHDLLVDEDPSNDLIAKTIAEAINLDGRVPSGMIPAATRAITYDVKPWEPELSFGIHGMPNPARGAFAVTLGLRGTESARVELIDVTGRRVWRQDVTGTGQRSVLVGEGVRLASGVYRLRLVQGTQVATRAVVVVH